MDFLHYKRYYHTCERPNPILKYAAEKSFESLDHQWLGIISVAMVGSTDLPYKRKPRRLKKGWLIVTLVPLVLLTVYFGGRYVWREMRWRYIVVHHTASDFGNLEFYRQMHVEERGWPDIAYHFVINNGSFNTAVGEIEESNLWITRSHSYSTKRSYINYFGISVVMVGNFERHGVPQRQREALIALLVKLAQEYEIPPERIVGHREIWETACPGKHLNMVDVRNDVAKRLSQP